MRRAAKKDVNHDRISGIFQLCGCVVIDTSACHGSLLDIIVYGPFTREFYFVEIKNGNGKLTKFEKEFIEKHKSNSVIIRSDEEAINFCQKIANIDCILLP
jgi:hypothetical protein